MSKATSALARIPFTAAKYAELEKELQRLIQYRTEVMHRLQEARAQGDLSENGAYTAAKFELGSTNRRLRDVRFQLEHGYIAAVPKSGAAVTTVEFGCSVTLQTGTATITYQLVSEYEADPLAHRISLTSPIGKAIVGKKVGDTIIVHTPRGEISHTISTITA